MTVPLVISLDLEIATDHELTPQASMLDRIGADSSRLGIPLTVFTTADAAEAFASPLRRLIATGHEIGCHGTDHGPGDNYRTMSACEARRRVHTATARIETAVGVRPYVFRGPRMTTSAETQLALVEHGYIGDFSACPMRVDFWRSGGGSLKEFFATRAPFLPSRGSAFRRGEIPLVVVPLGGFGIPFLSGSLYLLGSRLMRLFFEFLLAQARRSAAPIVYLFHSYEFVPLFRGVPNRRPLHQRLYVRDPEVRYTMNVELWHSMFSRRDVAARTAGSIAREWLGGLTR